MNKRVLKWILLGVGVILVSAALAFASLILFVKDKPNTPQSSLTPDTSKDFGACDLIEKSLIKSTLGEPADDLHGPDNMGLIHLGGPNVSSDTQKCVYSFIGGGTMDNSFHASNGLSVEVYIHPNQTDSDNTNKLYMSADKEQIADLGDTAYFEVTSTETTRDGSASDGLAQKDTIKNTVYVLTVFSGTRHYVFTLSQPATESSFDHDAALTALKSIAKSADFSEEA
jgi:hypothetical protein